MLYLLAAVTRLVQVVRPAWFQLIQHIMTRGGFDTLVAQRLLGLADIFPGELGAHKAPEIMRFDVHQTRAAAYCLTSFSMFSSEKGVLSSDCHAHLRGCV